MSSRRLQSSQRNHITTNRCPCQQGRAAVSFASGEQNTVAGTVRQHLAGSFPCVLSLSAQNATLSCTTCETRFEYLNASSLSFTNKKIKSEVLTFSSEVLSHSNIKFEKIYFLAPYIPHCPARHRRRHINLYRRVELLIYSNIFRRYICGFTWL